MTRPDPFREIQPLALHSLRGANYWSRGPVTRLDLVVGAYDEISSAEVPGVPEALERALPGLVEHRCSIGERGGFLLRLRRGTYAPHITEHVALELQGMIGDDVGYGRARGGDRPGEYTVVFEHLHEGVGRRSATLALDIVRRAFAGSLEPEVVGAAVAELASLRAAPDPPGHERRVSCGITGGGDRASVRAELIRRGVGGEEGIVDVPPSSLLTEGLPYARSEVAVILDARPRDVPERYRAPDQARRLVSVLADAVPRGGLVVLPEEEPELLELVRAEGVRVALFPSAGGADPAALAGFVMAAAS